MFGSEGDHQQIAWASASCHWCPSPYRNGSDADYAMASRRSVQCGSPLRKRLHTQSTAANAEGGGGAVGGGGVYGEEVTNGFCH